MVGNSGSGKSTLARALAERLGVPHVELDAIFHQAGWTPLPLEEFRARVGDLVARDGWVIDGNYSGVRDLITARADTLVVFDLPRGLVMRRLLARTLRRVGRREELWNGNRESWRNLIRRDPEANILLWAWRNHDAYRERYAHPDPHLEVIRLRSGAEAAALLERARAG